MAQPQADAQAARNAAIVAVAANQLATLWPRVDWQSPDAVQAVTTVYGAIVRQYGQATATIAAQTYDSLRATKQFRSQYRAVPSEPVPQVVIEKAVRSAFLGNTVSADTTPQTTSDLPVEQRVPARLEGGLQRHVVQPARDTIAENAAADPEQPRYIRVPRGAKTCAFCVMLASRELQSIPKGKANFSGYSARNVRHDEETGRLHVFAENGDKYHDHCDCEAVPVWPGDNARDFSPNFQDFQDMYQKATADAGTSSDTKKILAKMRELHGLK
jgi:hypothetical protein